MVNLFMEEDVYDGGVRRAWMKEGIHSVCNGNGIRIAGRR